MSNRGEFCSFSCYEYHKGFYNLGNAKKALLNIYYTDFFDLPDNDEFPYSSACQLLCGSCNHFVIILQKVFGYNAYVIESEDKKGFHAFCQIYQNNRWFFVDARGITSSFSEFMDVAKIFVGSQYIIRPLNSNDKVEWEKDSLYDDEAYAFAEAVITKYKDCYTFEK